MTRLSAHFSLREMTASQLADRRGLSNVPPPAVVDALRALCINVLEPVRAHFRAPVRVSSGYRSPAVNAAVGGSRTSQHCRGEAADIEVDGVDNLALALWIRDNLVFDQLISECYRPGDPTSGWVHVSWRAADNRRQALTFSGGKYTQGLPGT